MTARIQDLSTLSTLSIALALSVTGIAGCDALGDADPRSLTGVEITAGDGDDEGTADDSSATDDAGETADDGEGCTLTQGYWKNHQPWPIADAGLCGKSWDDILHTPVKGDAWYIVAHQWIAASLNVAAGADVPADVQAALDAAEGFLADCKVSKDEKADALDASELLDEYNNGAVGPGHCDDGDTAGDTGDATTGDATTGDATTGEDCIVDCGDTGTTGESWPIPQ